MELESLPWYGQFGLFLVIGAILFGFFYFLHYSPKSDDIATLEAENQSIMDQINIARINQDKLARLEEEKRRNEAVLEQLKSILPEKREVDVILRRIMSLSTNARLRINDFNPQSPRQKDIYEEWPFQMSFEGNYHNLAIFFDSLSRLTKIFNIDALTITPMQPMSDEYTIKAGFTATTYIYHEIPVTKPKPKPRPRPQAEERGAQDNVGY